MPVQQMSNGRFRATVGPNRLAVADVLGDGVRSWKTKKQAQAALVAAERKLEREAGSSQPMTVAEWHGEWIAIARKASTQHSYETATKLFVEDFGDRQLHQITRQMTKGWLNRGRRRWTIGALRAMFADAVDAEVIPANPFSRLNLASTKGNRKVDPPSEEMVWRLIAKARELAPPGFAHWLQFACWTGLRPGEVDALRWDDLSPDWKRVRIHRQYNSISSQFDSLKNATPYWALVHPHAQQALREAWEHSDGSYCFLNVHGSHWAQQSRYVWFWKVRKEVGYEQSLYLATRHFFASYLYNVLGYPCEAVAVQLNHQDEGDLVRHLYGHYDADQALNMMERGFGDEGAKTRTQTHTAS